MSEDLFTAIYSKFTAAPGGVHNSFYTAASGQMAYSRAPESWTDNFAVIDGGSSEPDDYYKDELDNINFQVNIFSTVRATCFDLLEKCQALYDDVALTVTGHYAATLHRGLRVLPVWNEDDNLWQATIEFDVRLRTS